MGYNIFNHSNRYEGIKAAHENDMGVAIMNPLGGGMVTAAAEKLKFLVEHENETVIQAALRFVASDPGVTLALAGMGTVEHVEENVKVGDRIARPDPALVDRLKEQYGEFGDAYCTGCKYCLPCPEQINIPNMLACLNRHKVGLEKEAKGYYDFFKNMAKDKHVNASACSDCGLCEERCTQKLAVRDQLKRVVELFETE